MVGVVGSNPIAPTSYLVITILLLQFNPVKNLSICTTKPMHRLYELIGLKMLCQVYYSVNSIDQ